MSKDIKKEINDRFKNAFKQCEALGLIVSKKSAASILGLSPQLLSELLNNRINVSTEIIYKFCTNFEINLDFIFYGVQPIFRDLSTPTGQQIVHKNFSNNEGTNTSHLLKVVLLDSTLSIEENGKRKNGSEETEKNAFYLPNPSNLKGEFFAFENNEPHMSPLLEQGNLMIGQKLANKKSIVNGLVYIVEHKQMGTVTRRVYWTDKENEMLELVPENSKYQTKVVYLRDIVDLYKLHSVLNNDLTQKEVLNQNDMDNLLRKVNSIYSKVSEH